MKKTHLTLCTVAAIVLLCPLAFAETPKAQKFVAPLDVTSVAAAVPLASNAAFTLTDEEILGVASPVRALAPAALHTLAAQGLTVAPTEVEGPEGPETEGPDTDGPGGPDHQFEGEETGQH
jgi:hypothetical protein